MNVLNNMKMRMKLTLSFLLIVIAMIFIGTLGIIKLRVLDHADTALYEMMTVPISQLADMGESFQRVRVNLRDLIIAKDKQERDKFTDTIKTLNETIDKISSSYEKTIVTAGMKEKFQAFKNKRAEYVKLEAQVVDLALQDKDQEAFSTLQAGAGLAKNMIEAFDAMMSMKIDMAKETSSENTAMANSAITMMIYVILAVTLFSIVIVFILSRSITGPLEQGVRMMLELKEGRLSRRLNMVRKDEIGILTTSMDQFADNLQNIVVATMKKIAAGDISTNIIVKDSQDEIMPELKAIIESLQGLVGESNMLVKSAIDGKLDTRGNVSKFQGGYRDIIDGLNKTLDAVIGPLNMAAEYVDRISKGDIPARITEKYNGDFNEIKNNLNVCIDAVNLLVNDVDLLVMASLDGKLSTRADATKHQGDFHKHMQGINNMLDAILLPIGEGNRILMQISNGKIDEKVTQVYKGDHEKMKEAVNNVAIVIQSLQKELQRLTDASRNGELGERGKPEQFQGAYADVVVGINQMLDAILLPIGEGNRILMQVSNGKIDELITQTYKGDHEKMKQAINNVANMLQRLYKELQRLTEASKDGQLSERGNPEQFQGAYADLIRGTNAILDAVIGPLNEAGDVLQAASQKNMTLRMKGEYKGDLAKLKDNINATLEAIDAALIQVGEAVQQVTSGAEQISDASQSLSQGATEQASSLEEITSSMTEIGSQTKTNAENATQANGIAKTARDAAEKGNNEMKNMVDAMNDINASSQQIAKVNKVIDDIAFQTNLLALNAAVEAARAGRHGKGFAVVADEVRNLAGRSAKAAKETAEMIEASGKKVENGLGVAKKTSESFGEIVSSIIKVTDIVGEIAAASNEQAQGITQSNQGLEQVDQVTQQNTANAEETASAAEELSGQAIQLQELIRQFTVTEGTVRRIAAPVEAGMKTKEKQMKKIAAPVEADVKAKGKSIPKGKWGSSKVEASNEEIISLDSKEFGKY